MIKVMIGDIFQSRATTIVNTVNCVGVMGKGVAAEFKKRFPQMFSDYVARCAAKEVKLGEPYLYQDMLGTSVINFPTKGHWRSPSKLDDVVHGLDYLLVHAAQWGITSLAIPPLGCGNGGLDWAMVGPIMYQKLSTLGIPVEIYAPYGTPQTQLSVEFLSQAITTDNVKGRQQQRLNPAWLALLAVVDELTRQPYANPVGRTIFQKIAYILTEQGVNTGFKFQQASYGPFSEQLQEAVKVFANTNLIEERTLGRMTAIRVGPAYAEFREVYADVLNGYRRKIDKTVDLFSRIKSTEQAEEVATVLYAARHLKKQGHASEVSETDIYRYVLEWKKSWNKEDKRLALAGTIRNLEMLNWMRLQHSAELEME
ncbi:macro domain-containing protein [Aeromonas hydrophila]|uniref:type II toxin-antitoxin system antitoxin DNA ADP-ribosyl glycohydrolase DarG n=1 Tax=Aeromonas hydrophila TaxID=644 RepID=UPI002ED0B62A|nr:macro domain-containing protein [Aeromonas hydrophila]